MATPARPPRRARASGAGSTPAERHERVAAIDIGSNSIRQIVADVAPNGAIRVLDEMKAAPRLGAGLLQLGDLDSAAMRRATDAIARMATLARQLGARRIEAVATSAVREAGNSESFLEMVRESAGLKVRVLRGTDEARLAYRSALAHFDLAQGRATVADIGGGSLELAFSAEGVIERLLSLPFGALRLTEQFLTVECRRKDVKRLRRTVREEFRAQLPARDYHGAQLIGSGGSFTNLAGMHLAREGMARSTAVHGTRVSRVALEHILDMLLDTRLAERQAVPGLNPARADIIVAGLAVLAELMGRLEVQELVCSGYGIREGLLLEIARVPTAVASPGDARSRSIQRLAERCHFEEKHSRQVQQLALQLFDAVGHRIGCAPSDRQTLSDAALLHDIGYHINYEGHHKHSYYLIMHAELLGMSPAEKLVIANVARYHTGSPPKRRHANYAELDRALRARVVRLSALLRVADGFDRGHGGAVERLRVRWIGRALRITPMPRDATDPLRLEMWGAERKARLLSRLLNVPVEIVAPGGRVAAVDAGAAKD
jgi:exopolyphosphatase / guanosine-5'-triphosphate,3'-diphosphate pyrophosphatase